MAFSPSMRAERPPRWISLVLLILRSSGKVVLIRKPYRRGNYLSLPGGGDELYETDPLQTALRELKQETSIDLSELAPGQTILKHAFKTEMPNYDSDLTGQSHDYHLFAGILDWEPPKGRDLRGTEGEIVQLRDHRAFYESRLLLPPQRTFLARRDVRDGLARALAA